MSYSQEIVCICSILTLLSHPEGVIPPPLIPPINNQTVHYLNILNFLILLGLKLGEAHASVLHQFLPSLYMIDFKFAYRNLVIRSRNQIQATFLLKPQLKT